jgi:hypothetical protein
LSGKLSSGLLTEAVQFSLTLGSGTPALGLLANFAGLGTVYLVSAVAALCVAPITASFLRSFPGRNSSTPRDLQVRLRSSMMEKTMRILAAVIVSLAVTASSLQAHERNTIPVQASMPSREDV